MLCKPVQTPFIRFLRLFVLKRRYFVLKRLKIVLKKLLFFFRVWLFFGYLSKKRSLSTSLTPHNIGTYAIFPCPLCSPSSRTHRLVTAAPQVLFASLSSPAVMDIRRLLALASDKVERGDGPFYHFTFFLTSLSCHPKIFVKEFGDFLMPCHQHCLGINLLVQR